jgi:hypothetical protein
MKCWLMLVYFPHPSLVLVSLDYLKKKNKSKPSLKPFKILLCVVDHQIQKRNRTKQNHTKQKCE